ncbi:hypothetical protein N8475_00550 [Winogradskyella sp.]|nr:hypothetical protein [Winogradskyella sp.]
MVNLKKISLQKNQTNKLAQFRIFLLMLIFLLSELLNKTGFDDQIYSFNLSFILKLCFVLYSLFLLIKNRNTPFFYGFMALVGFLFFEILLLRDYINLTFFTYSIRYCYFIFFLVFCQKHNQLSLKVFLKLFDFFILINSIFILTGLLFDIGLFQTYRWKRFGYDGIFNMPSDNNYSYVLYAIVNCFYLKHKDEVFKYIALFNILISLLTGTKTVIIVSLIALIYIGIKLLKKKIIPAGILILSLILVFRHKIAEVLEPTKQIFARLYNENGLLSSLTSTRYDNLKNTIADFYNNYSISNILFYSKDFINIRVEMELFDLFFFWGFLGLIIYLYTFFIIHRTVIFNKKNFYILSILLLTSFFAGKFLTNFTALFLLYIFLTLKDFNKS